VQACLSSGTPIPPPLTNYEVSGKFALRLPRGLYLRATKAAAKEGVSLNLYVATAVAEKLGADGASQRLEDQLREVRRLVVRLLVPQQVAENSTSTDFPGIPRNLPIQESAQNTTTMLH
jgi:hypothetical protein